jgi:hypothetical protein
VPWPKLRPRHCRRTHPTATPPSPELCGELQDHGTQHPELTELAERHPQKTHRTATHTQNCRRTNTTQRETPTPTNRIRVAEYPMQSVADQNTRENNFRNIVSNKRENGISYQVDWRCLRAERSLTRKMSLQDTPREQMPLTAYVRHQEWCHAPYHQLSHQHIVYHHMSPCGSKTRSLLTLSCRSREHVAKSRQ